MATTSENQRTAAADAKPDVRRLHPAVGPRGPDPRTPERSSSRTQNPAALFDRLYDAATSLGSTLRDWLAPGLVAETEREVRERVERTPMDLNGYGYDPWGFQTESAIRGLVVSTLLYRHYFRVETRGIENVPAGRVLLIANHAGQIAIDAVMIGTATLLEAEPPRIVRGMGEYWLPRLPFLNVAMVRAGSVVGTPKNCVDLLASGQAVIAFPEGVRGMNKAFRQRYSLQEFGLGFLRLALETDTPIVPIAVVGSEEQAPSLGNLRSLAHFLGMPAFPLLLTPVPLPSRYSIEFGPAMRFEGNPHDEDRVVGAMVEQVKGRIRGMIEDGLRRRTGIFW